MKSIPFKHREAVKYLEYCKVSVRKFGVCATNKTVCEQLPVHVIGSLVLGPGTSITSQAVREIAKSGCVLSFSAGGGIPQYSTVLGYRNATNATAQMKACFDEAKRLKCAQVLIDARNAVIKEFCPELGRIESDGCASVEEILLKEAAWAKKAYGLTSIVTAGESYGFHKKDRPVALYNFFVYNLVHSALLHYGYVPDVGIIHSRTRGGGLVFDIADVFKPALVLQQSAFAGVRNVSPDQIRMEVLTDANRMQLKKRIHELLKRLFAAKVDKRRESEDTT